jgi:antitoxin-like ribbon-helix-helix protein
MSKKPSLAALKQQIEGERRIAPPPVPRAVAPEPETELPEPERGGQGGRIVRGRRYPTYREGKVPVGGYFSPELSRALHQLALDESVPGQPRVKIQSLIGEAIDLLLRDRGKSPFGER